MHDFDCTKFKKKLFLLLFLHMKVERKDLKKKEFKKVLLKI